MLTGIDEREVIRAEQRLREDRMALDAALHELARRSRRSLTSPATIALLLIVGGIAGAGGSRRAAGAAHDARHVRGILRSLWPPLLKTLAAFALQRVVRR